MGSTHIAKCKWCRSSYQRGNNALIFIKLGSDFCSTRCESEYKAKKNINEKNNIGKNNAGKQLFNQLKVQEDNRKSELREIKDAEEKAIRLAKALAFKQDGKPYSAFLTEFGQNIGIASFFILIPLLIMINMGFKEYDKEYLLYIAFPFTAILIATWVFLLVKFLKEYFRKQTS